MATRLQSSPTLQLRNACDACNAAKVKCSQSRPSCKRCEDRALYCQYSLSLRSAKQRRLASNAATATTGSPSGTNESSKKSSPEAYDEAPTPPASWQYPNAPLPLAHDQLMPSLNDSNFPASLLEAWSTDMTEVNSPHPFSDDTGNDSMVLLPQPAECKDPWQAQVPPDAQTYPNPHRTLDTTAPKPSNTSLSTHGSCNCQSRIVSTLSDLSTSNRDAPIPFDKRLSQNKDIIALCTSAISCPRRQHDEDIMFMLTIVTLINHVIAVYDDSFGLGHRHPDHQNHALASPLTDLLVNDEAPSTNTLISPQELRRRRQQQTQPFTRVRLSLGSYQLDQEDEQVLQLNLLKIELSKISTLVNIFEKRFCTLDHGGWHKDVRQEPKPLGEIIAYMKKRLRRNFEVLMNLAAKLQT